MIFASQRRAARWRRGAFLLMLAGSIALAAAAGVAITRSGFVPSERQVARRLRTMSARTDFPLHGIRCVRDERLPRTFACFAEGPFEWHVAWEVRWLSGGALDVRDSDGQPVGF